MLDAIILAKWGKIPERNNIFVNIKFQRPPRKTTKENKKAFVIVFHLVLCLNNKITPRK